MTALITTVGRIDDELRELAEALHHTRDDIWREVWLKRADTLLDRRLELRAKG